MAPARGVAAAAARAVFWLIVLSVARVVAAVAAASPPEAAPEAADYSSHTVHVIFSNHLVCTSTPRPLQRADCRRDEERGRLRARGAVPVVPVIVASCCLPRHRASYTGCDLLLLHHYHHCCCRCTIMHQQDVGFTDLDSNVVDLYFHQHFALAVSEM